jgi:hypothetical protein
MQWSLCAHYHHTSNKTLHNRLQRIPTWMLLGFDMLTDNYLSRGYWLQWNLYRQHHDSTDQALHN